MTDKYFNPNSIAGREAIRAAVLKQEGRHVNYAPTCLCAGCQFGDGKQDSLIVIETQYRRLYDRQELNKTLVAKANADAVTARRIADENKAKMEAAKKAAQEAKLRRDFDQRVNSASIKIAKVLKQHGLTFGKTLTQAVPLDPTRFGDREQYSIEFKQSTVVNPLSTFLTTKQINQSK